MALPYFIKYIYSNGTEEVIRRGKKIFNSSNIEIIHHDELAESITFRVKDDMYASWYKVQVSHYKNQEEIALRCTCPYNISDICKHESAVLFELQQMQDRNLLKGAEAYYDQQHTVLRMKRIELHLIRSLCATDSFKEAEDFLRSGNTATILEAANEKVIAEISINKATYTVVIQKNKEKNFDTSCNCNSEENHPICLHKAITLLQLLNNSGADYFDSIRNWEREKNQLLGLYGFSLEDDLKDKFEFTYKEGKPFLRVLDPSIKRVANPNTYNPQTIAAKTPYKEEVDLLDNHTFKQKVGIVLQEDNSQYPYLSFVPIQAEPNEDKTAFVGPLETIDLNKFVNVEKIDSEDRLLLQQLRKLIPAEVSRYLNRNSPFSGLWENIVQQHDESLTEDTRKLIIEYLHPKYKKLFQSTSNNYFTYYLPKGKSLQSSNIQLANYSINYISPSFEVQQNGDGYEIICIVSTLLGEKRLNENELSNTLIYQVENQFYLWQTAEEALLVEKFMPDGALFFKESKWQETLHDFVLPLSKNYQVNFSNIEQEEIDNIQPEISIHLAEKGDYLILEPVYTYLNQQITEQDNDRIIIPQGGKLMIVHRNKDAENTFFQKLKNLHSNFAIINKQSLALKGNDVLKNNWFFLFVDAAREMKVPVYGFELLKKYRFNTSKPTTIINLSSHTDWFDAKVNIDFGGQKVTVTEIKKALQNKQQFVTLSDGTLGVLPEEWLQKYSLLFQIGETNNQSLKLSKYHFNIVDELYAQRDEGELIFQLEEKYEKIKEQHSIGEVPPPEHLQPILRPYQLSGFQWLNYLNDISWGGILADDMGLGKTIQALSFLFHLKQKTEKFKALVVCPTSLLYNWENEIKKFTPGITYFIHHGASRNNNTIKDENIDIIITTYGTLRSDIKSFTEINFSYVVLDESQAIKNPMSKIAKAVNLLNAGNRLCLSGTPLQNNTFDIYAQMNFLNPGLLGSIDWFKQQFAIPIDKFGEQQQKEHLRKMLFPFILRRTKEQVAKDLPEKTEQVLYCEMGAQQRKIYDAYRNDVRDKILGLIEQQGMQRSQLSILQGLMKLRQICDSPAIIKEEDYPNHSIKIHELGSELEDNLSNHKALIFSQFLGMLGLIKTKLEELGIKYEYFDGGTSVKDREKAIQNFQNDEECRVFLISLKAGGVGLNLTAADYVYIVDPWWNPAVEQQAIDRTHRIGQTKNIFAYRMICKDTVEDKILLLQEKKRALANELIADESGFVKNLSKADIEYLFS
ncbi:DEAD/DEAH box helicase [Arachidicoccus soli]|uniref:DEAD/DEAH box helicase n=1 Tax=Arachidicoccus soli TaxID=2341117 RepID=A0A386HLK4_9BACT|nr:DEAD/DEAH box helicase [Arachidicoccus soli]AYD46400.1 DEAD/DEAH box helicase [Arachidicoccus soli]